MAQTIDVKMFGGKDVQRKLDRLPNKFQKRVVKAAAKKAAEPILAAAKARAPVASGRHRDNLKIAAKSGRKDVGAVIRTGTRKQLRIPVDAKGYYPAALEFGTPTVAARPHIRPALDAKRGVAIGIFGRELGIGVEREARNA